MLTPKQKKQIMREVLEVWDDLTEYDSIKVVSRIKRLPLEESLEIFDGMLISEGDGFRFRTPSDRQYLSITLRAIFETLGIPGHSVGIQFSEEKDLLYLHRKHTSESKGESFGNKELTELLKRK